MEHEILDIANNWASLCARCLQCGRKKISCPAKIICINCSTPGHKAAACNLPSSTCPVKSSLPGNHIDQSHIKLAMTNFARRAAKRPRTVRCEACSAYGNLAKSCFKRKREQLWKWIPKIPPPSHSTPDASVSTASPPLPATLPRQAIELSVSPAMAKYPLNPVHFLPPGWAVEPGPADRLVLSGMVVHPIPPPTMIPSPSLKQTSSSLTIAVQLYVPSSKGFCMKNNSSPLK